MGMTRFCSAAGLLAGVCVIVPATANAQMTPQRYEEIDKLPWVEDGSHKLPESGSTLSIPPDHAAVFGANAVRYEALIGAGDLSAWHVEAVVINGRRDEYVMFQSYNDEGYVSLDDWKDLDATALLARIKKDGEKLNAQRIRDGFVPLHVNGWIEEPTLDRNTNTVRYAISLDDGTPIINAVAIRLSRHGYEYLTWAGNADAYVTQGGELDLMLRSHAFDPGSRYTDFVSGDQVAAYGVGALVATLVGAKLAKVGLFAGLLVLLKKFGVFIVVALGALLARFRRVIFGQKQQTTPNG